MMAKLFIVGQPKKPSIGIYNMLAFSAFSQDMAGNVSEPTSVELNLHQSHYALYAYDGAGELSQVARAQIIYVLNHYAIFVEDADNNISDAVHTACVIQPLQFPINIQIPPQFITAHSFKVTWNAVPGIDHYRVYIKKIQTNETYFFDVDQTEYVAINLAHDTAYAVYVASNLGNNVFSAYATPVQAQTLALMLPINTIVERTAIRLLWEEIPGATLYAIYHGVPGYSDALPLLTNMSDISGYIINNLMPATQYTYCVIALDATNNAIASGRVTARTLADMPNAPMHLVITNATWHSFDIQWDAVAQADYYAIYLNYNEHAYIPYIYTNSTRVNGLRADTMYAVTVVAFNNAGRAESEAVMARTLPSPITMRPAAPRLISPNPDYTTADPTPTLYWEVPDGLDGERYEFLVEIAEDVDFTQNVRQINSTLTKQGFSYESSREANSKEIVNYRIQDALVIY